MRGVSLYRRALAVGMLVLIRAIAILPLALSRRIGKGMGVLLYVVLIGRRKLAMDNVEQAFGATLTQAENDESCAARSRISGSLALNFRIRRES